MRIISFFKNWYQRFVDYLRKRRIDKISNTLTESFIERAKDRSELKGEIVEFIKQEFKFNLKSDFIPPSQRRQIVDEIYLRYRQRLEGCGLALGYNLTFSR